MKGFVFYRRAFLNRPGKNTVACVLAEVREECEWPTLIIADCSRQVALELSLDEDEQDNTLEKLDILYKTVRDFRRAVYAQTGRTPGRV